MKSYCCLLFFALFSLSFLSSAYGYTREDVVLAVAAAVLGDAGKVTFMPMEAQGAYTALLSGKVDLLMLHQPDGQWSFMRDSALPVDFVATTFYDRPGVLVKEPVEGKISAEIAGSPCIAKGEERAASFYLASHGIKQKRLLFSGQREAITAFFGGKCSMLFGASSLLLGLSASDTAVLPQKKEQILFGPIVRHGDDNWFDIVRWSFFTMLNAEALGISSQNLEEMRVAKTPRIKQFFAQGGSQKFGLAEDWVAHIIGQVGNYGEVFSRNIGEKSTLNLERSSNRLWLEGGLHCPPPFY